MNMHKNKIGIQFFAMQNLDQIQQDRTAILQRMADATRNNDTEAFTAAFGDLASNIEQGLSDQIREMQASQDAVALAARGRRALTSEERKFYTDLMQAMRSDVPKQALTGVKTVFPETVIDQVFDDLRENHPLLEAIDFQNTKGLIKILLSTTGGEAKWGELGAKVDSELSAEFTEVDLTLAQLTAFIPVPKYVLDLGPSPEWMDRYVRELLAESIAVGLETGAVDGDGDKKPIGMNKKLTGAIDSVHTDKDTETVTALDPVTYGKLLDKLTVGPNKKRRAVNRVVLIVNPSDYFTKVFPATTVRAADGTYNHNIFPFPTTVIQSVAVPQDRAIIGLPKKYFLGIGAGTSGGKIEYSDHYQFLERNRVYLTYLYGYGKPMDDNAFLYLDISGLEPANLQVEVVGTVSTQASEAV